MKKAKLLALLACLVFVFSTFAIACTNDTSEPESTPGTSSEITDSTESNETPEESEGEESTTPEESEGEESTTPTESESESVEPVIYSVTFVADGNTVDTCYYTLDNPEVINPDVPAKDGYTAAWEEYEISAEGGDITVNAVYTAIEYTITFVGVDGIEPIKFTVENMASVTFPEAPAKDGYKVTWSISEADLTLADVSVTVVEERLYTVKFLNVEGYPDVVLTESELATATIPAAPTKDGYVTGWKQPVINAETATIEITYWEMSEEEYYTRDVEGDEMANLFVPFDAENNSVEWDETEQAYHFVNVLGNTDDDRRSVTFDRGYINKLAELGANAITFEVKFDATVDNETLFRGYSPDWYTQNWNIDTWQLKVTDWRKIVVNMDEIPVANDGALKTIFLLGDKGSGIWIRNIKVSNPDYDNLTDRDYVDAFTTHYYADTNKVTYDETEGAVLFTNDVLDQDNKRGFWMSEAFTSAIKDRATAITFNVKFVGERASTTGGDNSLYIINSVTKDGWFDWGAAQQVGYASEGWVGVRYPISSDLNRIALLCTSGSFYIKDITFIAPEYIPEVEGLTAENFAKMFNPLAANSSVAWDETEGAFRFIMDDVAASNGDNSRAFILNPKFMAKLRAAADGISFKVKFLNDTNPVLNADGSHNNDRTCYIGYGDEAANGWWDTHEGIGYQADAWVEHTTWFYPNTNTTFLFINSTDDFLVKDFTLKKKDTINSKIEHEYEVAPIEAVVGGLRNNTVEEITTVDNAPQGVNGTALKLSYTALYGGFALSFPKYIGEAGNSLIFRVYVGSSLANFELWFYNIEYSGAAGDLWHYKASGNPTNTWVDIIIDMSNLPTFLNSNGEFVGFQVGIFANGITDFYMDSVSIATVTVTQNPDIPLIG